MSKENISEETKETSGSSQVQVQAKEGIPSRSKFGVRSGLQRFQEKCYPPDWRDKLKKS